MLEFITVSFVDKPKISQHAIVRFYNNYVWLSYSAILSTSQRFHLTDTVILIESDV